MVTTTTDYTCVSMHSSRKPYTMCVHMCHATALHLWSHVQACTGQLWVTNSKATCSVADFKPLLMAMEAKNLEPSILLMQKVR